MREVTVSYPAKTLATLTGTYIFINTVTLNMKRCRSSLANSEDPVMKCSIPLIIHELGVSPGCTLAVSTMMLLFFKSSYEKDLKKDLS